MTHVPSEQLWQLERAELDRADAALAEAHLTTCADCRADREQVRAALSLLSALAPVPPLPPALARRVGAALEEAAQVAEARRWTRWFSFEGWSRWALAGAAVAAVVLAAYVVTRPPEPSTVPPPLAHHEPTPSPALTPTPTPPVPSLKQPGRARVASAKSAKSGGATLAKAQVLTSGAQVATEKGGSLWMNLPDGTRAGLTGSSEVKLSTLDERAVDLEVQRGSLAMLVPHREDRVLTVHAGEVVVKDLGTRFLVSRDSTRVLVAVQEGSVEVSVPGSSQTVRAGHAVEWHDGHLEQTDWHRAPAATPSSVAKLDEDDDLPPAPQTPPIDARPAPTPNVPQKGRPPDDSTLSPSTGSPEDWAPPPTGTTPVAQPTQQAPPAVPPSGMTPAPFPGLGQAPSGAPRDSNFGLKDLEREVTALRRKIHPFPEVGGSARATDAREVRRLADAADCEGAVAAADEWLAKPTEPGPRDAQLVREVLLQKQRCLTRLNRFQEAEQVRRVLEGR